MKKRSCSFFAFVAFIAAVLFRGMGVFAGNITVFRAVAFYCALAFGIIMVALGSFGCGNCAPAFGYDNVLRLDIMSYLCTAGFFVDFVSSAVRIFMSVGDGSYLNAVYFVPLCLGCAAAIISSFYFIMVGLSFDSSAHDFRRLKIVHISPVLWAVSKMFAVLTDAAKPGEDINIILKYIVLIFLTGAFYFFASEVLSQQGTKQVSLFAFKAVFYTGMLYCIDQIMLVISHISEIGSTDGMLAVTVFGISVFMYFLSKNITTHSELI